MNFFQALLTILLLLQINMAHGITTTTDKIAAIVNHHIILDSDIKNTVNTIKYNTSSSNQHILENKQLYYTILDQLIIDKLIFQIAIQENISIDQNQLDQSIRCIASFHNMTMDQFYIYLDSLNLNYKKYSLAIHQEILKKNICSHAVYKHACISSNEIKKMAHKLNFIDFNTQFELTHIVIELPIQASPSQINKSENLAKLLIKKRISNTSFQNLIHIYHDDNIFSKVTVQETGWITWKDIPIIFDQYLQTAKQGDIIGPIYSYDGIHILEVRDLCVKKHTFPIIKVKTDSIISKDKSKNIHIKQELLKVKDQIENGNTTFSMILKEKSKDFYSENYENSCKWKDIDYFSLPIQKSILSLKKNQMILVYTTDGWCLIKLIDINKLNYNDIIYERAYLHLLHQKFNEILDNWIQTLKSKSYIKVIN